MTIETLLFSATAQILASAALGPLPQRASLYLSLTRARKFVFQMASFAIPVSLKDFFTLNYRILNYYTECEYDEIIQVFITAIPAHQIYQEKNGSKYHSPLFHLVRFSFTIEAIWDYEIINEFVELKF